MRKQSKYKPPVTSGFIYIWYDRKHKRFYVGCHWGDPGDSYVCSSRWMNKAYKRRKHDFKRRIVKIITTSRNDLFEEEYRWLQMIKPEQLGKRYYNLHHHHKTHWTTTDKADQIKQSHSEKMKAKHQDPEFRAKYLQSIANRDTSFLQDPEHIAKKSAALKAAMAVKYPIENRHIPLKRGSDQYRAMRSEMSNKRWANVTDEQRAVIAENIRQFHKGKQWRLGHTNSPEHTAKIIAANTGKKRTPEQIERNRQAKLGHKQSAETVEKRRQSLTGRIRTEQERAAISAGRKGKPLSAASMAAKLANCTPISVDGTIYPSNSEAAREIGVSVQTITNRLNNSNFPTYFTLDK